MALSPEELEQVRAVVRQECQSRNRKIIFGIILLPVVLFACVLTLHIMVIGGFTVYHLMQH